MCGIGGGVGPDLRSTDELRESLIRPLRYRGRDSEGSWTDDSRALLIHTRLSIIDLVSGQQPMSDVSQRYRITFNGEIYNYRELRAKYESMGARFASQSDTEVILQGYALLGPRVLQDLNGMFAFAIWDTRDNLLFLARDRLGKKPLYWIQAGSDFFFSSSLDSFQKIPGWNSEISKAAICMFTAIGSFPAPLTIYKGASSIPPGCYAVVRPGRPAPEIIRYWSLKFDHDRYLSTGSAIEEYSARITKAIRLRLRSDVPIGLTFSGGVDSGTIAAICRKELNADVPCFTIDYDAEDDRSEEVAQAAAVARSLDLKWEHIQFDYRREMLRQFPGAYANFDQPCLQFPLVYSRMLYGQMKANSTVVLSGNGADEIFTGYSRDPQIYASDRQNRRVGRLPKTLNRLIRRWYPDNYSAWHDGDPVWKWATEDLAQRVLAFGLDAADQEICLNWIAGFSRELREANCSCMLDQVMYRDLFYSAADSNFRLPDITGYSAQVEVRSPYLDYEVVEFAARLPHHLKVGPTPSGMQPKWLPKTVYSRWVGKDLAWATKRGMGANLRWDRQIAGDGELGREVWQSLAALEDYGIAPLIYQEAYKEYESDYRSGKDSSSQASTVVAGFMLGYWLRNHRK